MSPKPRTTQFITLSTLLALVIAIASCHQAATTASDSPRTFGSPDEAGNALITAAKAGDQPALAAIFGPDSQEVLHSGDPVQDKNTVDRFVAGYAMMHRWREMKDGSQTLLIGSDNFPFPIPLKKNGSGQWYFDTAAGKNEILNRRIGRNELAIIDVCNALVGAQDAYHSKPHEGAAQQYAAKFISDPGKKNGLYWVSENGQPESPLGPQVTLATTEGYKANPGSHAPFHGYYFLMLSGQTDRAPGGAKDYMVNGKMTGGFAFVAYPAVYGTSGVMTFITNQDGVLLQKDLGANTAQAASAMTKFDPDPDWTIVGQ
jgi:hypothetical protein